MRWPWQRKSAGSRHEPAPPQFKHLDGWKNVLTGLGQKGQDSRNSTVVMPKPFIDQHSIDALYNSDAIAARIIDAIPEHATRRWINVTADGAPKDFGKAILDALEELDAPAKFADLMRFDRKDGGALLLMGADDGHSLDQELDMTRILRIRHLHLLERWWVRPEPNITDPRSPYFGQPSAWSVMTSQSDLESGVRIHPSRVFALRGIHGSDLTMRRNQGWGLSVFDRVIDPLRRFNTLWDYTETTFKHLAQTVLKMKGLAKLLNEDKDEVVIKRLMLMQLQRSTLNAAVLDEGEELTDRELTFAGVAEMLRGTADNLAGAAEMPLTVMFGHSPAGFGTDDVSGKRNFYDSIAKAQRRCLMKPINRLIEAIVASKKGPTKGVSPGRFQTEFCPLEEPSDDDISKRRQQDSVTDEAYVRMGAIDADEVRGRLRLDPHSPYDLDESPAPGLGETADVPGSGAALQSVTPAGTPDLAVNADPSTEEPAQEGAT